MKATKRLVKALMALVASIILCIGVCLAWFATNGKVEANDMNSNIKSTNIIQFDIEAYELTDKKTHTSDGNSVTTFIVGNKKDGASIVMAEYGGLVNASVTALLLKFTYKFDDNLNKNYAVYADCESTRGAITSTGTGADLVLKCALSSVIDFYDVSATGEIEVGTTVTQLTGKQGENAGESGTLIALKDGITDSVKSGSFYCIIDYTENKIFAQYYKALSIEGTSLSTPMDFLPDIEFYIGESSATV